MAKFAGREITLVVDSAAIGGVRTKNPQMNKEPIDVTDDDSSGWRELLALPGQREVNLSVSGVVDDDTLRAAYFASETLHDVTFTYPDGGELAGSFFLASYNETGEYNGATTFESEFQSTGAITYTPPSV